MLVTEVKTYKWCEDGGSYSSPALEAQCPQRGAHTNILHPIAFDSANRRSTRYSLIKNILAIYAEIF